MIPKEANRIIHEWRGKCWHGAIYTHPVMGWIECDKCKDKAIYINSYKGTVTVTNPDYTVNGAAYLEAIQEAMKEEWWKDFLFFIRDKYDYGEIIKSLLTPSTGALLLAEWIEKEGTPPRGMSKSMAKRMKIQKEKANNDT